MQADCFSVMLVPPTQTTCHLVQEDQKISTQWCDYIILEVLITMKIPSAFQIGYSSQQLY